MTVIFSGAFKVGDWVVVSYEDRPYPGEVTDIRDDSVIVNAMEPTEAGRFYKWPNKKDVLPYLPEQVIKIISPPVPCDSRMKQFRFHDF